MNWALPSHSAEHRWRWRFLPGMCKRHIWITAGWWSESRLWSKTQWTASASQFDGGTLVVNQVEVDCCKAVVPTVFKNDYVCLCVLVNMKCMIGTWFYSEKTQSNFEKKKKNWWQCCKEIHSNIKNVNENHIKDAIRKFDQPMRTNNMTQMTDFIYLTLN